MDYYNYSSYSSASIILGHVSFTIKNNNNNNNPMGMGWLDYLLDSSNFVFYIYSYCM
jgi:hypothetical protein